MKNSQNGRGAQRLWRGLTAVTPSVLALALSAQPLVNASRTDIDKFLGTQSSKTVTDDTGEKQDLFTYKSDYAGTGELLNAIEDLGERMSEEGTVLLKNNGALPLSAGEKGKVSLLGFSSYYPVRGGIMGSSFIANQGTDADTVDLVQALTAKGFTLNPDLQPLYQGLESVFTTEVQSWGGTITYTTIYGTRTYAVETVKIISNSDWSYLQATSDDRITLTTCLADHPESRVVVQAVETRS